MTNLYSDQVLTAEWIKYLTSTHGPMVSGASLRRLLGFEASDALGRAIQEHRAPVPTFKLPGRQPHFAWTEDVAKWLGSVGAPLPTKRN